MRGLIGNGEVFGGRMESGLMGGGLPKTRKLKESAEDIDLSNLTVIDIALDNIQTCITPITDLSTGTPFNLNQPPPALPNELYNQDVSSCVCAFNLQYNLEDLITNANTCSIQSGSLLNINYV